VSAVGLNFWVVNGGLPTEVGGTSAATPVVAGIVSLLNDARLGAGKGPLGFVNQAFYAHPEAFTDITEGSNPGGGGCGIGGFNCAAGWDPITGMARRPRLEHANRHSLCAPAEPMRERLAFGARRARRCTRSC
jgi:tripeptidyl-peptidase-1